MVIRISKSLLLSTFDDFRRSISHVSVSVDNGTTWRETNRILGVSSLNFFLQPSKGRSVRLFAIGHSQIGRFVEGTHNTLYLVKFDINEWRTKHNMRGPIPTKKLKLSREYNFLTSNSGATIHGSYVLKQLDIIPASAHKSHFCRVVKIAGKVAVGEHVEVSVTLLQKKNAPFLKDGLMPHTLGGRISVGMKVQLPFAGIVGAYVTRVSAQNNTLGLHVVGIKRDLKGSSLDRLFAKTRPTSRVLYPIQDGNNWWYAVLWADTRTNLFSRGAWHLSNIVCSPNFMHSDQLNRVIDISLPTVTSPPYPKRIYPHAEEGMVVPTPSGGLAVLMRYSNSKLCDLALHIPVHGHRTYRFWLGTPSLTAIPGFGRTHPGLTYDPATRGYWMVSNVGRSLHNLTKIKAHYYRESQKCIVERNAVGLYFSKDLDYWYFLGVIDYDNKSWFQLSYPFVTVDGEDLLVTMRTTTKFSHGYNNHNANAIYMYRIPQFRDKIVVE
jgi:hypothetical protein